MDFPVNHIIPLNMVIWRVLAWEGLAVIRTRSCERAPQKDTAVIVLSHSHRIILTVGFYRVLFRMVWMRWAMVSTVHSENSRLMVVWISSSVSKSTAAVASSRIRIFDFRSKALARHSSCLWPTLCKKNKHKLLTFSRARQIRRVARVLKSSLFSACKKYIREHIFTLF